MEDITSKMLSIENVKRRILVSSAIITMLLLFLVWLSPKFIALYHQIVGGNILNSFVTISDDSYPYLMLCEYNSLDDKNWIKIERAINYLEIAIRNDPSLVHAYLLLGQAYCIEGKLENAIDRLRGYIHLKPNNPLGYLWLGFVYDSMNLENNPAEQHLITPTETESSENAVQAWRKAGVSAQNFIDVGNHMVSLALFDQALVWYNRAISLDPDNFHPWHLIAEAVKAQGLVEEAIGIYRHAHQYFPDNRDVFYELGSVYELRSEWNNALDAYRQALSFDRGQVGLSNLYYRIGNILHTKISPQMLDESWLVFQNALEIDDFPIDTWQKSSTYYQRGLILAKKGNWRDAIAEYQQAIEFRPNYYAAIVELARAFWRVDDEENAVLLALDAVEIEPENKHAYRMLGDLYLSIGDKIGAREMYSKVLELDPDDQHALQELTELNQKKPPP